MKSYPEKRNTGSCGKKLGYAFLIIVDAILVVLAIGSSADEKEIIWILAVALLLSLVWILCMRDEKKK